MLPRTFDYTGTQSQTELLQIINYRFLALFTVLKVFASCVIFIPEKYPKNVIIGIFDDLSNLSQKFSEFCELLLYIKGSCQ